MGQIVTIADGSIAEGTTVTQIAGVGGTPTGTHSATGWSYNITHTSITLSKPTVADIGGSTGGVLTFVPDPADPATFIPSMVLSAPIGRDLSNATLKLGPRETTVELDVPNPDIAVGQSVEGDGIAEGTIVQSYTVSPIGAYVALSSPIQLGLTDTTLTFIPKAKTVGPWVRWVVGSWCRGGRGILWVVATQLTQPLNLSTSQPLNLSTNQLYRR